MSLINDQLPAVNDTDPASHETIPTSFSGQTTAVPSPTTSQTHLSNGKQPADEVEYRPSGLQNAYLDVPDIRPPPRRPSVQSTYSDFSELSYHPSRQNAPLMRTDSSTSDHTPPRSPLMRKLHSIWITNYGALLVLCSQLFGCLMNLSTRLLETPGEHGEAMHPFQILFARQGITAAVCISYGLYTKSIPDFPLGARGIRWLLVLRGVGGFFGVFGLYFSLLYLPLSEATVLTFLGPILTCYVCSLVLKGESFTRQQQLAAFVSLAGVVLIARPHTLITLFFSSSDDNNTSSSPSVSDPISNSTTFLPAQNSTTDIPQGPTPPTASQHLSAIGISLIGVLGATCAMTTIRAIGSRAHPFISINYFSVWCTIVSLVSLIIFPEVKFRLPGNLTEWGLLASLGACGFVMQWLLTEGLAYGSASNAKPMPGRSADVEDAVEGRGFKGGDEERIERRRRSGGRTAKDNRVIKGAGTRATSMVYTQMLFALAGDKIVFGVVPTALSWLGSGLILAGAVWVAAARDQPDTEEADVSQTTTRRQSLVGGGGLELNTVAANAVGIGGVDAGVGRQVDDTRPAEQVGLMDDLDDLVSDDDGEEVVASPSSSSSRGSQNRSVMARADER